MLQILGTVYLCLIFATNKNASGGGVAGWDKRGTDKNQPKNAAVGDTDG